MLRVHRGRMPAGARPKRNIKLRRIGVYAARTLPLRYVDLPPIEHSIGVARDPEQAFALFTTQLGRWWPREYTWSQDVLQAIGIEPRIGGLCYELGPHGFRCDWGRVLVWTPPDHLVLAWHISPRREPVPDPAYASRVEVYFRPARVSTVVELTHSEFARHGKGAEEYRSAMASPQGWPRIMQRFAEAAV